MGVSWHLGVLFLVLLIQGQGLAGSNLLSSSSQRSSTPGVTSHGAYLHIPFCRRRCYYCDFSIEVIGDRESTVKREAEEYTALLLEDISRSVASSDFDCRPLDTVYFGGGTPSLLPVHCVESILASLQAHIGIAPGAEVTLELDPATFDAKKALQTAT